MQKLIFLSVLLITPFTTAQSETFAEQQKKLRQQYNQEQQNFTDYSEASKSKFANYLEEHWKQFKIYQGKPLPLKPKPKLAPSVKPIKLAPTPKPAPRFVEPTKPKQSWVISFYGQNIVLGAKTDRIKFIKSPPNFHKINKDSINDFWQFKGNNFAELTNILQSKINQFNIDDWGIFLLVGKVAKEIYPNQSNLQRLSHWKLLYDLGFDAKIAIAGSRYVLLANIERLVYRKSSVSNSGNKYYLIDESVKTGVSLHTLDVSPEYKKPFKNFNPAQMKWSNNPKMIKQRQIAFEYSGKKITLNIDYDLRQVQIEPDYPIFKFDYYFAYSPNSVSQNSLRQQLQPHLKNKTKLQQAQLLLTMLQKGIAYKTDAEQFGEERYLFPEETLHYPYADCEDRSFLYGWLVNSLLGLEFVGLYYPNHLATAIKVNARGDGLVYHNQRFVVADPTYIGAKVGQAMKQRPKVIYQSR